MVKDFISGSLYSGLGQWEGKKKELPEQRWRKHDLIAFVSSILFSQVGNSQTRVL